MYYAQVKSGIVIGVTETAGPIDSPDVVELMTFDASLLGQSYDNGVFTPVVAPVSRKLTHLGFRGRFTQEEQEWADELEVTFEANPAFSAAQKKSLRTGYKNFNLATEVDLDDPRIPPMLGLYVLLGGLTAERPAQILA
jgi:hypothetical protein